MKFLRNASIRQIGVYVLSLMFVIYAAEYFLIQYKIDVLDEAEQKLDFTRKVQLSNQQILLSVQQFIAGDTAEAATIESQLTQQEHQLNILGKGGRIERTEVMLKPLTRLPRITYDNLIGYWSEYKDVIHTVLTTPRESASGVTTYTAQNFNDSVSAPAVVPVSVASVSFQKAKQQEESLGITLSYWYDNLFFDLEEVVKIKKAGVNTWVIAIIIFDILLLALVFYGFDKIVLQPVQVLTENASNHKQVFDLPKNEIGKLSVEVNEILENLKDATDFVSSIAQGNLSVDYKETLDSGYQPGKNKLADSLIDMQQKLKVLGEEERKRQWANEGLTKFVDILRSSSDNINVLGDKITSALVHYTDSNQGSLYILNDEDENNKYLELVSLFAFDIKKFETRKIKLGEGLLGQTFLEKETTYYKSVPEEYIRITSGLGEANPRSILIVPLKVDKEVYGIVELASFTEYDQHEIDFVERLGETIASTLSNVRSAEKNRHLIEQFQQQTEEMRAQEEEMRQNMEELQATQEEVGRKEKSYITRINELEGELNTKTSSHEMDALKNAFRQTEQEYRERIQELEKQLAQTPQKADDWETAEDAAKALKFNLEALQITEEELRKKLR
ncbi:MAG TPA: GAF domain-containing protein [Ohtaekwangia sp.]